jgi:hypothetical protein
MTGKVEIGGLMCMNKKKQEARGKDRNNDARKAKESSDKRQTQQSIKNEAKKV